MSGVVFVDAMGAGANIPASVGCAGSVRFTTRKPPPYHVTNAKWSLTVWLCIVNVPSTGNPTALRSFTSAFAVGSLSPNCGAVPVFGPHADGLFSGSRYSAISDAGSAGDPLSMTCIQPNGQPSVVA